MNTKYLNGPKICTNENYPLSMLYIFLHGCGNVLNWHLNFRCSEKSSKPFGWSLHGYDRGSSTNEDTLSYFMSVDIPLHELYGMSETSGGCMGFANILHSGKSYVIDPDRMQCEKLLGLAGGNT